MQLPSRAYDLLGALLAYPGDDYLKHAGECRVLLDELRADGAAGVAGFVDRVQPLAVDELQELYTITFDLNPVCSPEVGWHLYGETYERGEFLVRARRLLRQCDIAETGELPDHLRYLLPAMAHLDPAGARTLIEDTLLPAIGKMVDALAARQNPFELLLNGIQQMLIVELAAPQAC